MNWSCADTVQWKILGGFLGTFTWWAGYFLRERIKQVMIVLGLFILLAVVAVKNKFKGGRDG